MSNNKRFLKFPGEDRARLKVYGFDIDRGKKAARLDGVTARVICREQWANKLTVELQLPNGHLLYGKLDDWEERGERKRVPRATTPRHRGACKRRNR